MKLIAVLILTVLSLSGCSIFGDRKPSGNYQWKKHYVITMHGVRGNDKSYGDFHDYVDDVLKKIDPSYEYQIFNWTYPVGAAVNDDVEKINWNPHSIAHKFNQEFFLGPNAKIPQLGPEDKISIIAYSMGGQMVMSWYYNTMFNYQFHPSLKYSSDDHRKLLEYLERVDNIIGLGAVYWGSLDSELGWSFLDKGSLNEIFKLAPKLKKFCETSEIRSITEGVGFVQNVKEGVKGYFKSNNGKELTQLEKQENFVKNSVIASCSGAQALYDYSLTARAVTQLQNKKESKVSKISNVADKVLNKTNEILEGEWFNAKLMYVTPEVLKKIHAVMKAVGNMNPSEMENMRLNSDTINEFRLARINHLALPEYRQKFKAKWTSIVGAFPCLGKLDEGLTCTKGFKSEEYKRLNQGFTTIFSGLIRRETDGPVMSPGANADFIYYVENPGQESTNIGFDKFTNTFDIQKNMGVPSKEILVENMHATVSPALEALPGLLEHIGKPVSKALTDFDASLGLDVVIMNKECAEAETCKHPNFKHVIETLTHCESGSSNCNQDLVNQYFGVKDSNLRYEQNNLLKDEMSSYVLNLNIRLPKNIKLGDISRTSVLMKYINFNIIKSNDKVFGENRLDYEYDNYFNQIARSKEILSSFADVKEYKDVKILRAFFVGRAWPKQTAQMADSKSKLESGVPVRFEINIPGVKSRRVVAKVKPRFTTYVDLYMK